METGQDKVITTQSRIQDIELKNGISIPITYDAYFKLWTLAENSPKNIEFLLQLYEYLNVTRSSERHTKNLTGHSIYHRNPHHGQDIAAHPWCTDLEHKTGKALQYRELSRKTIVRVIDRALRFRYRFNDKHSPIDDYDELPGGPFYALHFKEPYYNGILFQLIEGKIQAWVISPSIEFVYYPYRENGECVMEKPFFLYDFSVQDPSQFNHSPFFSHNNFTVQVVRPVLHQSAGYPYWLTEDQIFRLYNYVLQKLPISRQ